MCSICWQKKLASSSPEGKNLPEAWKIPLSPARSRIDFPTGISAATGADLTAPDEPKAARFFHQSMTSKGVPSAGLCLAEASGKVMRSAKVGQESAAACAQNPDCTGFQRLWITGRDHWSRGASHDRLYNDAYGFCNLKQYALSSPIARNAKALMQRATGMKPHAPGVVLETFHARKHQHARSKAGKAAFPADTPSTYIPVSLSLE